MTTFYFIRHGKTALNQQNCFQGGTVDSPLLPESLAQARRLGQYLKDQAFDHVLCSTQKRAVVTAHCLLQENEQLDGVHTTYDARLCEMKFGTRDGQKIDLTDEQTDYLRNRPDLYDPQAFGGETFRELVARGATTLEEISAVYPTGHILVVAHGVLLITLTNYLLGKEARDWRQNGPLGNTSLTIIQKAPTDSKYTLTCFNKTDY